MLALAVGAVLAFTVDVDGADEPEATGQQEVSGRSGFWTSRAPARHGAYRWRLVGVGCLLLMVTAGGTLYLIRKASASRR